jgi:hypothetical protein
MEAFLSAGGNREAEQPADCEVLAFRIRFARRIPLIRRLFVSAPLVLAAGML